MTKASLLLAAFSIYAPLGAQWSVKTAGIPRTADGKPNLSAPAPRMADGKPDLSGLWEHLNARDAAYYLKGIEFPWTPAGKALIEQRKANNQKDNPEGQCLPRGLPKADAFDIHKVVQTPGLIVILYEYGTTFRQIFTDGRALPKDPNPTWMGYSVGHWDGDTLVVESNGFNGKAWMSFEGIPVTDSLHLTERMHRRDFGHMDIQLTIDDPKAYTKPWTTELHPELIADTELIEFVCNENEKDVRHLVGR